MNSTSRYGSGNDHIRLYHVSLAGDTNSKNHNHYNFGLEPNIANYYQRQTMPQLQPIGQQSAIDTSLIQQPSQSKRKAEDEESILTKQVKLVAQHELQPGSVVYGNIQDSTRKRKPIDITSPDDIPAKGPKLDAISELEQESYKTSGGLKSSTHGDIYQLKLLMLFLHRGIENKYNFKLATEREGVRAFDDVFFEYDQNKRSCLQAKHKLDEEEKITYSDLFPPRQKDKTDGEFAIQKYFISYLEAKLNSNEGS